MKCRALLASLTFVATHLVAAPDDVKPNILVIVSDCEIQIVTRGVKKLTALPLGIVYPHVG